MEPALGDWGVPFGGRTSALLPVCGEDASASPSDGGRAAATPGAGPQKEHRRPRRAGDQIAPRPRVAVVTNHERRWLAPAHVVDVDGAVPAAAGPGGVDLERERVD